MLNKLTKKSMFFLYNCIGTIYMFLTLFFPDSFRVVRLAIFLVWAAICIVLNKGKVSIYGGLVLLAFLMFNVLFLVNGLIFRAPGALRIMTVDFAWPIIFFFIVQYINTKEKVGRIIKVVLYSYLVVCLFDVMYLVTQLLSIRLPGINILEQVLDCKYGRYGSFIQYTTTHMVTHIFMLPFCIALFLTGKYKKIINTKIMLINIMLGLFCAIASSRVAFQLVVISSVPLSLIVKMYLQKTRIHINSKAIFKLVLRSILFVFAMILVLKVTSLDLSESWKYIVGKINTSRDATHNDNGVRAIQKKALLEGWLERPLIGHGTGSYTPKSIRDEVQKWAYEYSYYALLFQKGIAGFLAFFGFIGWIILRLIKAVKKEIYPMELVFPYIIGLICILVANYADPYLGKFGCMWMVFIPFAIANSADSKVIMNNEMGTETIYDANERTDEKSISGKRADGNGAVDCI